MEDIIVGSKECSIHDVWMELSKSNLLKGKWSDFAGYLRIPLEDMQKLRQDLQLDKINRNDILRQVLLVWVADQGTNARLTELIRVLEDKCGDDSVGEKLRISYNLPCKNFQINSTNWITLPPAFQEKVKENLSKFWSNIPIKTVETKLDGDILLDLMTGKMPKLFKSTIPSRPKFYLERTILPRHTISEKVFDEDAPDIFIFTGLKEFELGRLVKNYETSTSGKQLDSSEIHVRFMILEQKNHFKEICKRARTSVHLLSYDSNSGKIGWLQSHGRINNLQKFIEDCQTPLTEEQFLASLRNKSPGPIIISDSPGMGKSFLLANLAYNLEDNGNKIVIFTSANDFTKQVKVNSEHDEIKVDSIKVTLQNIICTNPLGLTEFSFLLSASDIKVELFMDGFDEVSINNSAFALDTIKIINESFKSIRLWITTRPHHLEELEAELNVLGYNIKGFDDDDQASFLASHWQHSELVQDNDDINAEKLTDYASKVLQKIKGQLNKDDTDIAGIPLQCLLIAEVFEEECIGFVSRSDLISQPRIRINSISDLYKGMVTKKLQKYLSTHVITEFAGTNDIIDAHVNLSLKLLFPEYNHALDFIQISIEDLLNIGIVQTSISTGSTEFIHRTFAEYFVAGYVTEKLVSQPEIENDEFASFFLEEILMRKNYFLQILPDMKGINSYKFLHQVICYFLNVNISPSDKLLPQPQLQFKNIMQPETKMEIYQACTNNSFLQIFKLFFNDSTDLNEIINLLAIRNSTCEYFKFIMSCLGKNIRSIEDQHLSNLLRVAVQRSEPEIIHFLIKTKLFDFRQLIKNVNDSTKLLLHDCVANTKYKDEDDLEKRVSIMQLLVEINPYFLEERDCYGRTPLLCEYAHVNLLKELIRLGADVSKDLMGETVLHLNKTRQINATEYHSLLTSIPKQNLAHVLKVSVNNVETPLIKLLTFIDPTEETLQILASDPTASLHAVAFIVAVGSWRNTHTLECLIKLGVNLAFRGNEGASYLHFASQCGNLDAVKFLIENNYFDVNIQDYHLHTPMDYAIGGERGNRLEVAKVLYNFGGRPSEKISSRQNNILNKAIETGNAQSIQIIQEILKFKNTNEVKSDISSLSECRSFGLSGEQFKLLVKTFVETKSTAYRDSDENSLLHLAVEICDEIAVKELVENGADVNKRNRPGSTPMHKACACFDLTIGLRIIKFLIDNGADAYSKNEKNFTLVNLLLARATLGDPINPSQFHEITEYLAERNLVKALFTTPSGSGGNTPLQFACQLLELKEETLVTLYNKGISFNQLDYGHSNALMHAIMGGRNKAFLNMMINKCGADWTQRDKRENSCLHFSAQYGNLEALKLLIDLGLDVNQVNMYGYTPLHHAAMSSKKNILETAKILVEVGADASIRNHQGQLALDLLHQRKLDGKFDIKIRAELGNMLKIGNVDIASNVTMDTLLSITSMRSESTENNQELLLHKAVLKTDKTLDRLNVIKSLIPNAADVYAKDPDGNTFLHTFLSKKASPSSLHEISEYLLSTGHKDLFETPGGLQGSTPLHLSIQYCEPELKTLQLFKSHRINLNRLDNFGFSVLMHAILGKRSTDFLSVLVNEFGVDWKSLNIYKQNVLHIATQVGNKHALKFFLNLGLDVNAKDLIGNPPILYANLSGGDNDVSILQLLFDNGADVNAKNTKGYTMLHITAFMEERSKILPVIQLLIENGADPYTLDYKKFTFLHILVQKRNGFCPISPLMFHQLAEYLIKADHYKLFHIPGGKYASTPAQFALLHLELQKETLSLLYSNKTDINYADQKGVSSLSYALLGNRSRRLCQELVNLGADINQKTAYGESFLHIAARQCKLDLVELFIELELDVKGKDNLERTPLSAAASRQDSDMAIQVIQLLLKNGADPNSIDSNGCTPLDMAVGQSSQSLNLIKFLINNGAKVDSPNSHNSSYIHLAAEFGGVDVLKFFLGLKDVDVNALDGNGRTPLHYAMCQGESDKVLQKVQILLEYGADINSENSLSLTPLHYTAFIREKSNILPVITLLIESGADVFAVDQKNLTFLHKLTLKTDNTCPITPLIFHQLMLHIIERGYAKLLHTPGGEFGQTPAQHAVRNMKLRRDTLSILYSDKTDINYRDNEGDSCLAYAVYGKQSRKLCQELVDLGADMNQTNVHGESFLHISSKYGLREVVELFVELGLNVNAINNLEGTPLFYATCRQDGDTAAEIVKLLVENGGDYNAINCNGNGLVHMSAFHGVPEVVEVLLGLGLNANAENTSKQTPLHISTFRQDSDSAIEIIKCLVNNGADANASDINGCSPLYFAITQSTQSLPLINYLIDNGAKVDFLNSHKTSYIHLSAEFGGVEVLKFFLDMNVLDVNAMDGDGATPLYCAVFQKESDFVLEKVRLLVECGADVTIPDLKGLTPLNFVERREDWSEELKLKLTDLLTRS